MDFYNLQESDHSLLQKTVSHSERKDATLSGPSIYQEYLSRHFFDFDRVLGKKCILLAEEDPRVQQAMQKMILEANVGSSCTIVDSVEEVTDVLEEKQCDLLIANYYLSEDEIDYEFWEDLRAKYPEMEVIILSHVNDREYYDMLEKVTLAEHTSYKAPLADRIRNFLGNVFGG